MVKVRKDLSGQKFGKLLVLHQTEDLIQKDWKKKAMWHCLCDCGNECNVRGDYLKNGHTTSCGCYNANFNDLTGMSFGRISVINYAGMDNKTKNALWNCQCKCGNKFTTVGVNLTRTGGMRTCKECRVIDGKNDIPTLAPWMEKYFINKDDIFKYSITSNKKIFVKCPDCGHEKFNRVCDLYRRETIGCICSDSISYPEKFFISFFNQTNIFYKYQYSPTWINNRRYDFYIPSMKLIIEVDGGIGHGNRYTFNGFTPEELLEIDKYKDNEAIKHGLKVVRINAVPSDFNTLKNEIIHKLKDYFEIELIDFELCHQFALSNLTKSVCEKWEYVKNIKELSNIFKLSLPTIRKYLKNGAIIGWCSYDAKKEQENNRKRNCCKIKVYKEDTFLGEYESFASFAKYYNEIQFEIFIDKVSIASCCKQSGMYKGLKIERVST